MIKWIVAYDIPDDRRRKRLSDILEDFGDRVQYSVFEIVTRNEDFPIILGRVDAIIDANEDSVRFYPLCEGCAGKVLVRGLGMDEPWQEPDVYIV